MVAPTDGTTQVTSSGLIGNYLTGTPTTAGADGDNGTPAGQVSNISGGSSGYVSTYTNSSDKNYNNFYTSAPVAQTTPAANPDGGATQPVSPDTSYIPIKMPANYNFQVLENGLTADTTVAFLNHNCVV